MEPKKNEFVMAVLVTAVTGATIFMSVINNSTDILYSLVGLAFGYYFSSKPPTNPPQ